MVTPNFGDNLQQPKMFKFRNKSADVVYPHDGQMINRSSSTSIYVDGRSPNQIHNRGMSNENYMIAMNEVLQIVGCQSLAELLQNVKKSNKEKKFCHRVFKLIQDIDSRKPESFKDAWRWIRTLIQDFVHLKKVTQDYQKILKKVDTFFNNSNSNNL